MSLIKSISGIRGTIGGRTGESLTPVDIVRFTYAYSEFLRQRHKKASGERYTVVVGRDARISGEMVSSLVIGTLIGCGNDVIDAGLASTPTTEMGVILSKADGGIIITASHNPRQWNALKLLNEKGEFLSAEDGRMILECAENEDFSFPDVDSIGKVTKHDFTDEHLDAVLALEAVDAETVRKAGFKVVLDAINSVGGVIMPKLLERLGVQCVKLNCEPTGDFAHNPEPLPCNLTGLSEAVVSSGADLGISVDPDVDRLAFICETGEPFVEEYTLVSIADYLFARLADKAASEGVSLEEAAKPYAPVSCSNLSSSRALRDVTETHGGKYFASAVGEVNVTTLMRETSAIIGGEGNGGVIYPALHYGRDAMVGVALFLTNMALRGEKATELKASYPQYYIAKNKLEVSDKSMIDKILAELKNVFASEEISEIDGVKIIFESKKQWVHLRRSNTEPIIRIYSEAKTQQEAEALGNEVIAIAQRIIG